MQISHAETEAEVVISNFSDLQSVVHLLKTNAEDYSTSSLKMKEMDKDIFELADQFNKKINLKKGELNQLDEKIHELQVRVGNGIFSIERCTINLTRNRFKYSFYLF